MSGFNRQADLQELYGNIDIYLFDQLLKGTYNGCKRILDAGCGGGRNVHFFLKQGFEVFGADQNPGAITEIQQLASKFAQGSATDHFVVAEIDELPFEDNSFDLVISSAVLHFARNLQHFEKMLGSMWRVLRKDGYFFCRLASDIGIESSLHFVGNGRYILPDGSERFLVNQETLLGLTRKLGATLHEPIKTTVVQNMRSMTTWCLRK